LRTIELVRWVKNAQWLFKIWNQESMNDPLTTWKVSTLLVISTSTWIPSLSVRETSTICLTKKKTEDEIEVVSFECSEELYCIKVRI
jgi:hypothetical protein